MTTQTISARCALCLEEYQAPANVKAYRGLCPTHWSADTLREWDRVEAARAQLGQELPNTLTLAEWLSIVAAWRGKCAMCSVVPFSRLAIWIPAEGLTASNVIPACKACHWHKEHGWRDAMERIDALLYQQQEGRV